MNQVSASAVFSCPAEQGPSVSNSKTLPVRPQGGGSQGHISSAPRQSCRAQPVLQEGSWAFQLGQAGTAAPQRAREGSSVPGAPQEHCHIWGAALGVTT